MAVVGQPLGEQNVKKTPHNRPFNGADPADNNNKYQDYEWKWDFRLESSQQLKIVVKVPATEGNVEEPEEGCVAIMFGFKDN